MIGVVHVSRACVRHVLTRGLSVALLLAAPIAAIPSSIQVLRPGADQGKGWCFETATASARGLEAISADMQRYVIRVVSPAEQEEKEAQARVDEAKRFAREARRALTARQEEMAILEENQRRGAYGPPDAELLRAEARRYQVEQELAALRGRADRATRLRADYARVSADPDSSGTYFALLLKHELDAAERAVAEESGTLQTLLTALEGLRLQVRAGRLRQGGPDMDSANAAMELASFFHQTAVRDVESAQRDLEWATADAKSARANRDEGMKCIADRRAQLAASETPAPGAGTPTPPPPVPTTPGPRSDFATTFFLTRFGWESGMSAARPVEPYLGGLYFHPDGTVTGWLQSAGSLSGTWQGTSANGTLKLNGGLEGEWRLAGLAFGSDALGGPIATAGQGAWCAGRLKALHYFGGIIPTPTNLPGADDRPRPGMTAPPADAEAMCKTL